MKRSIPDSDPEEIDDESFEFYEAKNPTTLENVPWIDKYSPQNSGEICINPTKLKQLRQLMQDMISIKTIKMLVIVGPSGSSKSTSAKILAKELVGGYVEYSSDMKFGEFLNDCKYLIGKNMKFVIIEELPNIFHRDTLTQFRKSLNEWVHLDQSLPPLVLCLTEIERNFHVSIHDFFNIENNLNATTLLGKDLLKDLRVESVKFNGIAKRFMNSTITRITNRESSIFKRIPKLALNKFLQDNDVGDVRSRINNLELWSRYYIRGVDLNDPLNYNRNTTINLFHAIGKVIYSSSKFKDLDSDESNSKTIDDVLTNYDNLQLLHLSILENYSNFVAEDDLRSVSFIADNLSLSESIYELEEGKDSMIRGTRVGLAMCENVSSSSYNKIVFSKNFNMIQQFNKVSKAIHFVKGDDFKTSFDNINLIDGFYVPLILSKRFHQNYGRIGGKINVPIDDDLYEEEDSPTPSLGVFQNPGRMTKDYDSENDLSDPIEDSEDDKKKPLPFESDYEFSDESDFL
ncbi:RFC checkpoint protein Rad17 [Yamadazyma tenuis]|uniref:RFC checkpoint protein Rad17 n=1 Tax=Candida tenuis TaxID=2315449 RepID=UPI00279BDBE9|nr:RFC checkpoint protein Rad17 [Yamadazyma tenuis]